MTTRRFTFLAAAATAAALALTSCAAGPEGTSDQGDTLTLGAFYDQTSFDPAGSSAESHYIEYMQAVYDSLVRIDSDGIAQPSLATSWSYDETKTTLTIDLRDDVTFTDGTAFDADAVKANIEHSLAGSGTAASSLASVASVSTISTYVSEITLTSPDPALVYSLGSNGGFMASPAAIEEGNLDTEPVGSGPYVLSADGTTPGSSYEFVRNAEYWDTESFPYDTVVIKPLTTEAARLGALESGQIDAVGGVAKMIDEAEANGLTVSTEPGDWQGLFIVDRAGSVVPALGDVRVRQAINYAIDAEGILESIRLGHGTRSTQIFGPAGAAWDADLNDAYPHDVAKAKELLTEAGYPDGFDLPIALSTDYFGDVSAAIEQGLGDAGIRVQWTTVSLDEIGTEMFSGKYGVYFAKLSTSPIAWKDLQLPVMTTGAYNVFQSEDPTVDDLMGEIALSDGDEQAALYQELNAYLVEQAWFNPWYVQDNVFLSNADVEVTMQRGQIIPSLYNFAPAS